MLESFLIMFREVFEAALIIGIIMGFLAKTEKKELKKYVFIGTVSGIAASILGAIIFNVFTGGFEGRAEQIFEGTTMIIGAILLSTMIVWMIKNGNMKTQIENKLSAGDESKIKLEIGLLTFFSILREGVESVIFLKAASYSSHSGNAIGAVLGIVLAVGLGYGIYIGLVKFNLKKIFSVINILFILFAASLIAHGVGEYEEAKLISPVIEHLWGNAKNEVESEAFNVAEYGEEFVSKLIGFNSAPSLIQAASYFAYIAFMIGIWKRRKYLNKEKIQ